jgi:hypothetical protein
MWDGMRTFSPQLSCSFFTLRCQLRHGWLFMRSRSSLSEKHLVGHVRFQVLKATNMNTTATWDVASCSLVEVDQNDITRHCTPYGCLRHLTGHVCLSAAFSLGGRQPAWPSSLLWKNGTEVTVVTHLANNKIDLHNATLTLLEHTATRQRPRMT